MPMSVHPLDILVIQAASESGCSAVASSAYQNNQSVFACEVGAKPSTLFDIASITKILCTTASIYHLVSIGHLQFDDPLCRFLPEFAKNGKSEVTFRALLAHRSGLPSWAPMFNVVLQNAETRGLFLEPDQVPSPQVLSQSRAFILNQVMSCPLVHPAGKRVYSDFGFIALGAAIEAIVGQTLHQWTQETVFPRLNLKTCTFRPLDSFKPDVSIPPTGLSRPRAPAPGQETLYSVPSQPEIAFPGYVDDDNAFALGGVAGHAGVFATAEEVALFGSRLLNELDGAERLGKESVLREMIQPDLAGGSPSRGLGFDHPSGPQSSTGQHMTQEGSCPTFGHLGFTGCSLWVEPKRQLSIALLTNRVFPFRKNVHGIKGFRPLFHDALIEHLEST